MLGEKLLKECNGWAAFFEEERPNISSGRVNDEEIAGVSVVAGYDGVFGGGTFADDVG